MLVYYYGRGCFGLGCNFQTLSLLSESCSFSLVVDCHWERNVTDEACDHANMLYSELVLFVLPESIHVWQWKLLKA